MSIQITFLGTGGAFTDFRENYHTNALVTLPTGKHLLLDCGCTAVQALKELGIPVWDVPDVFITHMHGDHVGGLEQLIWERYYTGPNGIPGFQKTTIHHGPGMDLRSYLLPCVDELITQEGMVEHGYDKLVEEPLEFLGKLFQGFLIRLIETKHVCSLDRSINKPAYGIYLSDTEGHSIYYSGDCVFQPVIIQKRKSADIIFHDCSFSAPYLGTVHTHYAELLSLPIEIRRKIVLMHHTRVPQGIDPVRDGFKGAASRFQTFVVG